MEEKVWGKKAGPVETGPGYVHNIVAHEEMQY
jgi:hypothetical protein